MFEVGFTEIILILGLALLVLGPEKLPGLAQKVGRWTGRARSMARQLRTQLEHEVTLEELSRSRPMQSGTQSPAAADVGNAADPISGTTHPSSATTDAGVAAAAAAATSTSPGLDLDAMVAEANRQNAAQTAAPTAAQNASQDADLATDTPKTTTAHQ